MKRVFALAVALFVAIPHVARAESPPRFQGKSLEEWMTLYWTWNLGGDQDDQVGKVRFMPLPVGQYVSGSGTLDDPLVLAGYLEVDWSKSTAIAMGVAAWIGETYDPELGIPDDTPFDASIFLNSPCHVSIDGRPVIDSDRHPLDRFYFGPEYFDPPIQYAEPTSYGAIGAIWIQGLGFTHAPLSKGVHRMLLQSDLTVPEFNLRVIFQNEWKITVK